MKRSFMILAALLLLLLPSMQGLHAQDDNKSKLDFGTDMVSRYVQGWVNEFTEDPGPRGREAVARLLGLEPVWIQG